LTYLEFRIKYIFICRRNVLSALLTNEKEDYNVF